MTHALRHISVSLCALVAAGCYLTHERAPRADGGLPVRPADGASAPDARFGMPTPRRCPLERASASCLESFWIPAGIPVALPFQFDGCGCCAETECDVEVDVPHRTLRLGTRLCPDPCDCDACHTPAGQCQVPPLPAEAAGEWTVEVGGVPAFVIGLVDTADPIAGPPPGCATYALPDPCGGPVDFTMGPVRGDVCVEHAVLADREVLRLHAACWGCGDLDSACDTDWIPRLTDDLPPGADIVLHARRYPTACNVDCPTACLEHVRTCALPPLVPGDFYRVFVDGEVVATFEGGAPSPPCP